LDGIEVQRSSELKTPYEIVLNKATRKKVYKGRVVIEKALVRGNLDLYYRIYHRIDKLGSLKTSKLVQPLILRINPNLFSFRDIPRLVKDLVETHNQWISTLEPKSKQQQLWQINTDIEFARRFIAVARILKKAGDIKPPISEPEPPGNLASVLETQQVARLLEEIAQNYGANYGANLEADSKNDDHPERDKIIKILNKPRPKGEQEDTEKRLKRRFEAILRLVNMKLKEAYIQSLYEVLFNRSAAEVLRLTGMNQLLEDFERNISGKEIIKNLQVELTNLQVELTNLQVELTEGFEELKELQQKLQQELQQLQGQIDNSERISEIISEISKIEQEISETEQKIERLKESISRTQIRIANHINDFIYSHQDKYFPYKDDSYQPFKIAEQRYVNCVAIAFLQYLILQKYFGLKVLGATTTEHFFAILPLANGTYLSLDYELFGRPTHFNQGGFEEQFIATVLNWEHEKYPPLLAEQMLKVALDIDPNSTTILDNLAALYRDNTAIFAKHFGSEEAVLFEAEKLYLRALKIDRDDVYTLKNLAALYQNNAEIFAKNFGSKEAVLLKVEELYLRALQIDRNNVHILINLANLYRNNAAIFAEKFGSEKAVLFEIKRLYNNDH